MKLTEMEREVILHAAEAVNRETGFNLTAGRAGTVKLKGKGINLEYFAECKKNVLKQHAGVIIQQLKTCKKPTLLIAASIDVTAADTLRENEINYLDTAGNAYIKAPPFYLDIRGRRPVRGITNRPDNMPNGLAYQPSGLKVLFALLCNENLIGAPIREIAAKADVANGTVGWVMRDLRVQGLFIDINRRKRQLTEPAKLMQNWAMHYPMRLRPKIFLGRYAPVWQEWRKAAVITDGTFWGGEVAAEHFTNYIKPQVFTLYTRDNPANLIVKYNLKKDPNGPVEILKTFWGDSVYENDVQFVHPLLVYADLLASGDPRNIETANIIYEQRLLGDYRKNR